MEIFLEPVYLNEKMMLNIAAYLFKGFTLQEEVTKDTSIDKKVKGSIGFKFLQDMITPSFEGDLSKSNAQSLKSARTYTVGGLHMSVVEELRRLEKLTEVVLDPLSVPEKNFVAFKVILKPVDFYQIIEIIKLIKPLLIQLLTSFGEKFNPSIFNKNSIKEIPKYDGFIESIIKSLEDDYLNSKQLEMLMISPETNNVIGIVDIDLGDIKPQEIKAKLNDGEFYIIGKVSRYVDESESMSLVQRTILSKIFDLISKAVSLDSNPDKFLKYKLALEKMQPNVEKFVQLNLKGPAVRVVAMFISI